MGWYVTKNGKYSYFLFKLYWMMTKKKSCFLSLLVLLDIIVVSFLALFLSLSHARARARLDSFYCDLYKQNMRCLFVPLDTLATILMKDANSFLRFNKYWLLLGFRYAQEMDACVCEIERVSVCVCVCASSTETTARTCKIVNKNWPALFIYFCQFMH